jgi:hypothetical integral membrane protein (TIGR02206 family)
MLADSLNDFSPYGVLHFGTLVMMVLIGVLLGVFRRKLRRRNEATARVLDWQVAAVVLGIWVIAQGMEFLPERFSIYESLPIHICDIVALVAAWGVFTNLRLPRAVLYYWGIGLSTQALAQPELAGGPATLQFWVFWVPHSAIIVAALYDLIGRGFQPTWRDYVVTVCSLLLYLAFIIPIDVALNVNYGFVGNIPNGPLEFLGPWPMRVVKVSIGVCLVLAVMTIPWSAVRAVSRRRGPDGRRILTPVPPDGNELHDSSGAPSVTL